MLIGLFVYGDWFVRFKLFVFIQGFAPGYLQGA